MKNNILKDFWKEVCEGENFGQVLVILLMYSAGAINFSILIDSSWRYVVLIVAIILSFLTLEIFKKRRRK